MPATRDQQPGQLTEVVARLRAAGCVFAEDEARLLAEAAPAPADLTTLVARRVAGEPLEVIVGWAEFRGRRVIIEPGVFVPRRRTEFLAQQAIALAVTDSVVVDLCCGSGAVGLAIADAVPGIELHAADIEPAAVHCARRNVEPVGGQVHAGDLYAALPDDLRGRVDILAVNAPYVPTDEISLMPPEARDHEPHVALDGGPDGVDVHRRVAADARAWLAAGGHLLIETGAHQAPRTVAAMTAGGLTAQVVSDEELAATIVIGTKSRSQ